MFRPLIVIQIALSASLALSSCRPAPGSPAASVAPHPLAGPDEVYPGLYEAVQMARIFPDSKTFADCTPLQDPATILAAWQVQSAQPDFSLEAFVQQYFARPVAPGASFKADTSRTVQAHIQALWPVLTRQPDTRQTGTLLPLPQPYIVPGGRFGEVYYWDSYFTMLGLAVSDTSTRQMIGHMLDNFAFLIDTAGHIPNGNRVYYLSRSQPPFFALMVQLWAHTRQDSALLDRYYPQLQREYAFWMDGAASLAPGQAHRRVVRLPDGTLLNRYWDDHPTPRPESYREDVELARTSGRPPEALYRDLRAACESGWDFSSRWLRDGHSLATIRTTELIPADLNCLLYTLEMTLATVAQRQQQPDAAARYRQAADSRRLAIRQYSWDSEAQAFTDYDWVKNQSAGVYSLAGMFPLAMGLADSAQAASMADLIKRKFLKPGGLISTLSHTRQQWDAPNGWAPLQWMTIQGLRQYGYHILADDITTRWVRLNTQVYKRTGRLVEKYNVEDLSLTAGGGEYPLQDGFGWTNGVLLRLLYEKDKSHN